VNRGVILVQQGRDAEADRDFAAAFSLDPSLKAQYEPYINGVRRSRKPAGKP
jgi:hypothetical protein